MSKFTISMKGGTSTSVTVSNADLKNSLDCLQQEVRRLKFPGSIDYHSLAKGAHSDLVSVLRHLFCDFSPALTGHLNKLGYELAGKDERRFLETVYLLLRDQLSYRPAITCAQFLSQSYPSRKASLVADVCRLGRELAARLRRPAVHRSVFDPQRLKRPATAAVAPGGEVEVVETAINPAAVGERPRSAGLGGAGHPPRTQVVREPRHPGSCGASPRAPTAFHAATSATFPLAARYSVPVTTVMASEDEPAGVASRGVQTGTWATEQRVADLASGLAQQVSELAARLTLLEQRMTRLDGVAPPHPQQQFAASSNHRQPPPAQPHWAPQPAASSFGGSGTSGRLVQGRLQNSDESPPQPPAPQPSAAPAATASSDYRRRPPVSPSPPPMLRSRSREASGSEEAPEVAGRSSTAEAAEAAAAAEMKKDLLGQARRIEQLIAGTQSLLGSAAAPAVRASAE